MRAIIFDFDGTISDSFEYTARFLYGEAGITDVTNSQMQQLRGLSMANMVLKLGFHWWNGPRLLWKGRREMWRTETSPLFFKGMPEVLQRLHNDGYELFILTANSVRNVHRLLRAHQVETYISNVRSSGMFGKTLPLRWLLKRHGLNLQSAIYVGDERRDVLAAEQFGLRCVAVTWGFANRPELEALNPTAIVDSPAELLSTLKHLLE